MASKHIRADVNFAYPTAEIAVMGPDGAVNIVFKSELERAPGGYHHYTPTSPNTGKFANPAEQPKLGYIDEGLMLRRPVPSSSARSRC